MHKRWPFDVRKLHQLAESMVTKACCMAFFGSLLVWEGCWGLPILDSFDAGCFCGVLGLVLYFFIVVVLFVESCKCFLYILDSLLWQFFL